MPVMLQYSSNLQFRTFKTAKSCNLIVSYFLIKQLNFLSGRRERILFDGVKLDSFDLRFGVPQGGCLGPLLFGAYASKKHRRVFSTFRERSQMSRVFYHSLIHGLGFFTCFRYRGIVAKNRLFLRFYTMKNMEF